MKLLGFFVGILSLSVFLSTMDASAAGCGCSTPAWGTSSVGQSRIIENRIERLHLENRTDQLRGENDPFNLFLKIGGLYDTNPGALSGAGETGQSDTGLGIKAGLGYRLPLEGKFGFRVDYAGYADFHRDLSEFDTQEHHLSVEPQYATDRLVFSLPLGVTRSFENGRTEASSLSISPAITRLLASGSEAVAIYGHASKITDDDDDAAVNEDGTSFGGGISYFFLSGKTGSAIISADYAVTDYEAFVSDYLMNVTSRDKRNDQVLTLGLHIRTQLTSHTGLYAAYSFINSRSNVWLFDNQRHILEAGFSIMY